MVMEQVQKTTNDKKKSKVLMWVIIINIILWSTLAILLVFGQPKHQSTPQRLAYTMATKIIENNLKAPSTAEYQPFSDELVSVNGNIYTVKMWVDSENSFGARIRSKFTVQVKNEGDKWYLISISEN